jgi:hypothetical protein
VKQVAYQAEKPQASGKDDQLILSAEFGEDVLLILLDCNPSARVKEIRKNRRTYQRQGQLHRSSLTFGWHEEPLDASIAFLRAK